MISSAFILILVLLTVLSVTSWAVHDRCMYLLIAVFGVLVITSFLGLRSFTSGIDTAGYVDYFHGTAGQKNVEVGFEVLTAIFRSMGTAEAYLSMICLLQGGGLIMASRALGVSNAAIVLVLFIAFIPGLDMMTNGIRNGLALTLGLPLLVVTTVNRTSWRVANFVPVAFHLSYALIAMLGFSVKRIASVKVNIFVFCGSILFALIWRVVSPDLLLSQIDSYSEGYFGLSKLIRYLLLERQIMSDAVKAYFLLLSFGFSAAYFGVVFICAQARYDLKLTRLSYLTLTLQFIYSFISFSEYAYRFMFLAYPAQVLMLIYIAEKYVKFIWRALGAFAFVLSGIAITYSTDSFGTYELLDLF